MSSSEHHHGRSGALMAGTALGLAALVFTAGRAHAVVGDVTTLAGNGTFGPDDDNRTRARFADPFGIAVDTAGNLYIADRYNQRIRKINPSIDVTTLAGNGLFGADDGKGMGARFADPFGIAVDTVGNVYVADRDNEMIRKVTADGTVTTLAGTGTFGFADGKSAKARFASPSGIAVDTAGNVYVADRDNHRIRRITPSGTVNTVAGDGTFGFADGNGTSAQFASPSGIAVDTAGNLYITDRDNQRIRKITPKGFVTTLAGDGTFGFADGNGTNAQFASPLGIAVDTAGNLYITDRDNQRVRKIEGGPTPAAEPAPHAATPREVPVAKSSVDALVVTTTDIVAYPTSRAGASITAYPVTSTGQFSCSPAAPHTFPVNRKGSATTVTCTATGSSGRTTSKTFTVHVKGKSELQGELQAARRDAVLSHTIRNAIRALRH